MVDYEKFRCRHCYLGEESPEVIEMAKSGQLRLSEGAFVCDWKPPVFRSDCIGQDVSCYGPNHDSCPDRDSVEKY